MRSLMRRAVVVAGAVAMLLGTAVGVAGASLVPAARPAQTALGRQLLASAAPGPHHHQFGSFGSALVRFSAATQASSGRLGGSVVLDGSPGQPLASPKTATIYVPIQCTTNFCHPNTPDHVVDVINAAKCNAKVTSRCTVVARATVGTAPLSAALDPRTGTVYVVNGTSNTVSVLNGARCNARVTTGCAHPAATVRVGKFPVAAVVNPATRTLYVVSPNGNVFVINAATCNAVTTRGCGRPVNTVKVGAGSQALDVDVATDTIYTANSGATGNGTTVSVINGATCNGHTSSGCSQTPPTVTVGSGAWWVTVDQASDTVYAANNNDGTVSVINGATCNATNTSGCHRTPPTVTTGANPQFVAIDPGLHTMFTVNQADNTLSVVNTQTCNGIMTSGCRTPAPSQRATAPDHGPRFNPFPNAFALIPQTGTAYVVNGGGRNILSVTSTSRCNATNTSGCRRLAPSVPDGEYLLSADPATNTLYAGSFSKPVIDVINGATCNSKDLSGCAPAAKIPIGHREGNVGAIDDATHTLYASDPFAGTTLVINTATCNATHTTGCAHRPPVIKVGPFPGPPALSPGTRTLYVPYGDKASRVAVINAATCNATDTSGCGQAPAVVKVGQGTFGLAVSAATDTIYGPNAGSAASGFTNGHTVSVINGATCNGTDHTGCGHLAATATVGRQPEGAATDDATHTVYVANNANGDSPGTVSVINTATCNGTVTTGCHRRFPTMATGRSPFLAAVDPSTGVLYVTAISSAEVTILNGARCNAAVTTGCHTPGRQQAVGSLPFALAINPGTRTVYITQPFFQTPSLSIFKTIQH